MLSSLKLYCSGLLLAGLAGGSAQAATRIDQARPLDLHGRVEIENIKGSVVVRSWDQPQVRITGSLGSGTDKLVIDGDRDLLRIKARYPDRVGKSEPTQLIVQLPRHAELAVSTVSATIDVHGIASPTVSLESVSGDITANGAPRRAQVESVSGDVLVTFNSSDVQAESVSGDLAVNGRLDGDVALESVSGNVRMDNRGEPVRRVSASTVSGRMDLQLALAANARVELESVSGDIQLGVPPGLSAVVVGESFSGDLRMPGAKVVHEEHGPGSNVHVRYGTGKGEIRIETFSGNATLQLK